MAAASGGSGSDPGTSRGRPAPPSAPHRFVPTATGAWCDLCCRFVVSQGLRCADCKYTCHAHCRDLVHLGCRRNGKLMDCLTAHGTLHGSDSDGQAFEGAPQETTQCFPSNATFSLKCCQLLLQDQCYSFSTYFEYILFLPQTSSTTISSLCCQCCALSVLQQSSSSSKAINVFTGPQQALQSADDHITNLIEVI